jgi:hypothetical protein
MLVYAETWADDSFTKGKVHVAGGSGFPKTRYPSLFACPLIATLFFPDKKYLEK